MSKISKWLSSLLVYLDSFISSEPFICYTVLYATVTCLDFYSSNFLAECFCFWGFFSCQCCSNNISGTFHAVPIQLHTYFPYLYKKRIYVWFPAKAIVLIYKRTSTKLKPFPSSTHILR